MSKSPARPKAKSSELSARDAIYSFEDTGYELELLPYAARRALDAAGMKLGRVGWQSLSSAHREELVRLGAVDEVDASRVAKIIARAQPPAAAIAASTESRSLPDDVVSALAPGRALDPAQWMALPPLGRYVLGRLASKPDVLAKAYDEIVGVRLTHLTRDGAARMVDVAEKSPTRRRAVARAVVRLAPHVARAIESRTIPKGDVIAVARVAGIQAAKKTPDLIPLCHHIALTRVEVDFEVDAEAGTVAIVTTVEALDRTGVEMEALVAATTAALTLYDMVKSADRWATIEQVALFEKSGGRSGDVRRKERPR